jgi:tetratricopeptide (TPR) repeat protein
MARQAAWLVAVLSCIGQPACAGGQAGEVDASRPPWQRLLQGADAKNARELEVRLVQLQEAGQFEEALRVARDLVALREKAQGKDHWESASARWEVTGLRRVLRAEKGLQDEFAGVFALLRKAAKLGSAGRAREAQAFLEKALAIRRKVLGEEHPGTAQNYDNLANTLNAQGKYVEAAEGYRKALVILRKVLGEEHPDTATSYNNLAHNLQAQGKYAEAEEGFRKALEIYRKVHGEEHPDTATGYNNLAGNLNAQGKYAEATENSRKGLAIRRKVLGEEHPETASSYNTLAANLSDQGRHKEAEEGFRKALDIFRKVLGEEHPSIAISRNNLAANLQAQGKYGEAEEGYRKALHILRKVLGEEHPDTASSYGNLAANLNAQGRYAEAGENSRKALAIRRKVLGEEHPDTAQSYNNVAYNLDVQGKHAEAAEGYRKALAIYRKVLGEEHPEIANSYNNLAANLSDQGRHKEAEESSRKALEICRKVLGEEHPFTALCYDNGSAILNAQGRYGEAAESVRKALAIRRKVLGEEHPETAVSYNNLGYIQQAQGKYAEAADSFRKVLEIKRKVHGEEHPDTATSYNNLAFNLNAQGKYAEAADAIRKALAIYRKVLGEEHPDTATSYNNLASNLHALGKYAEAEELWLLAARSFATVRLHLARSGLERATVTSEHSPLPFLAAVLARNGKPADAWRSYEESLARGTWDDLSARLRRPPAEQARHTELAARLQRLDQLIEKATAVKEETPEQKKAREELLGQRRKAQDELDAFTRRLEKTYGPAAGQVFDLGRIQATLPDDTTLVGWIDIPPPGPKAADPNGEHWAFLLRSNGEPVCVRLRGSGESGAWTDEDSTLPADLRIALHEPHGGWQRLARRLGQQRLGPLSKHLAAHDRLPAVKHLIVLPSSLLAGVPVELLAEGTTVSYAHSGTLFAHLRSQPKVKTQGLFALADPVFEAPTAVVKEKPLPPGGVLLTVVQPGSNAARSRLRPGDVLLSYNDKPLTGPADLAPLIAAAADAKSITVSVWREEHPEPVQREVGPGKLGIVLAGKPAPEAIAEQRRVDRRLASRGDDDWRELPGTRAEVASITRLFGDTPAPLVLTDSAASEQKLDELARAGELKKYRYLHLATHGDVDDAFPLRSAVILSRDALPDPGKQLLEGKPVFDGRLTAEEVLRQWNLDCDLVTLSACQTALGKYERGEGFVGFAQALTLCGSRSVCLSLWKVDDAATALLMQRFYGNLLGKREGLAGPLGKAAALAEAKQWLRTLPRAEALKHAAAVYQGIERGKGRPKGKLLPALPESVPDAKEDRPYAHPYYWAAFVLTGDPD